MSGKFSRITYGFMVLILLLNVVAPSLTFAAADSKPPVIEDIKVSPDEVGVGNQIEVSMKVTDDDSGVEWVSTHFDSPVNTSSIIIYLEENDETGLWEGSHTLDSYTHEGEWEFSHIWATDYAGNTASLYARDIPDISDLNFIVKPELDVNQAEFPYYVTVTNEKWGNKVIDKDVYIGPDSIIEIEGNVEITGDVYIYGIVRNNGNLTINGTLHAHSVNDKFDYWEPGAIVFSDDSTQNIKNTNESTEPYDVPFEIFNEDLTNETGTIEIEGKTLPFVDVTIKNEALSLDYRGYFSTTIEDVSSNKIPFEVVDAFGNTIDKYVEVKDVVTPEKVTDFKVIETNSDSITVSWNSVKDTDLANYILYVNDEKVAIAKADETTHIFTDLQANTAYNLSIVAADESDNESEKSTIKATTNPETPSVDAVTEEDEVITGTSSPEVQIIVNANGKELATGKTDEKGKFRITIPKQTHGTELTVVAVGKNEQESKATKVTVADTTPPAAPEVNEVTDQSTEITGKAEANSTVIAKVANKEIGQAKANANGNFTIKIAKQTAETEIAVTATDKAGNVSKASKVVVKDVTAPEAPTVNQLTDQSTKITGTAEAASVVVATANNKQIGRVTAKSDGTFEMPIKKQAADAKVTVIAKDKAGNESKAVTIMVKKQVERISGYMRYDTAVEASKQGWDKADTVIIARGDDFADALAGVPLAHKLDAPILMTPSDKLWNNSLEEIKRLGAKNAIILGGEGAVSKAVSTELTKAGLKVERIEGKSRFETAALIAKEIAPNGTKKIVVANGMDFPDALSVASYAAKEGMPILLTLDDRVAKATESAVKSLDVKETLVVGGEAVVSKKVQQALPKAKRLSGNDRYETNIAIAKHFGVDSNHIYIATGRNYADALTGGVLAAKENSAILLVHHRVPESVSSYMNKQNFQSLSIFGGTGAVDDSIKNDLTKRLK